MYPENQDVKTPLRISRLIERDYMRIESLDISPGKHSLIVLKGPNEAGKTSALRGVISALTGKKADPEQPIRTGKKASSVEITLADDVADVFKVSASWTPGGRYLSLRELFADGTTAKRPAGQTMIQSMLGALSFSPLLFMNKRGSERLKMVLDALGKRPAYDALQIRRKTVFDRRTEQNRTLGEKKTLANQNLDPSPQKTLEPITDAALKAELGQIEAHNAKIRQNREKLAEHQRNTAKLENEQKTARAAAELLEKEIEALKARLIRIEASVRERDLEIAAREEKEASYEAKIATLAPLEPDDVLGRINANQEHNSKVAQQQEARKLAAEAVEAAHKINALTAAIEAVDDEILNLVQSSELAKSIPGLGVSPAGDLTYEGLPLEQASGQRQLELSCLVGMATNPRLRVMCFDEGDRLDPDSIKHLGALAEKNGYQLWMTAVYAGEADDHTHVVQLLDCLAEGATPPADPQAGVAEMYEKTDEAAAGQASQAVADFDELEL